MKKCGECLYRDTFGYCQSQKIREDWGFSLQEKDDMLVYDYTESGAFWVGVNFGCIHHKEKTE